MTETVGKKRAPVRTRDEKYDERRTQLAESALTTLGELGYARTSLREIAQHSEFSHGVVHYYFNSKADLIIHCVRYYKTKCSKRYDGVIATATTGDELVTGFVETLVETLRTEAPMHRLWYDLRGQSMFEPEFREQVTVIDGLLENMIWRIVTRYAELTGAVPAFSSGTTYAMVDGVFVRALLEHVHGNPDALDRLHDETLAILPALFRS